MLIKSDLPLEATPPTADLAIEVRGVSKIYKLYPSPAAQAADLLGLNRLSLWRGRRSYPEYKALNNVDVMLARGERVGIIGRNGAGKTTLLKLISGTIGPTSGTVRVNGAVQALMQVGVGFHPDYTGLENIRASLLYSGLDAAALKAAEADIIEFCELGRFLDQPLKTYSLGMQARLQFACATAIKPEILIVDEILGAGDAYFSVKSNQRMQNLTRSGCTLLLVSHSMAQVLQFCERVIWIDGGQVRRVGSSREVVSEYEVHTQRLAEDLNVDKAASKSFRLGTFENGDGVTSANLLRNNSGVNPHLQQHEKSAECADEVLGSQALGAAVISNSSDDNAIETSADRFTTVEKSRPQTETLRDGRPIFRWPSAQGLKLASIDLYAAGSCATRFKAGSDLEIRGTLVADVEESLSCYFHVVIFRIDSLRVARITSPLRVINCQRGGEYDLVVRLSPCRLLSGQYYINFSIMDGTFPRGAPARRFDLVARFLDFEVYDTLNYTEDGLFIQDAEWLIGGEI